MHSQYITTIFFKLTTQKPTTKQKPHPIAHPSRQGMGCLLWDLTKVTTLLWLCCRYSCTIRSYIDGLVQQGYSLSSALAMEILQSCTKSSTKSWYIERIKPRSRSKPCRVPSVYSISFDCGRNHSNRMYNTGHRWGIFCTSGVNMRFLYNYTFLPKYFQMTLIFPNNSLRNITIYQDGFGSDWAWEYVLYCSNMCDHASVSHRNVFCIVAICEIMPQCRIGIYFVL